MLAMALLCLCLAAAPAGAKEFPYILEPELSLTGDCSISGFDPAPDPDCPYPAPPAAPTGRFNKPFSIAIDAYGYEYVASYSGDGKSGRIDIFNEKGEFVSELSDPKGPLSIAVDSEGYLYAFDHAESQPAELVRYKPKTYEPLVGKIEYDGTRTVVDSTAFPLTNGVAVNDEDHLFVAQQNRIRKYSSATAGNTLLTTIEPPNLEWANFVAVDSQRDRLYTETCKEGLSKCGVMVLEAKAPYAILEEIYGPTPGSEFISKQGWISLAVDEETGHFFVGDLGSTENIYEFDENYERVSKFTIPGPLSAPVQSAVANNRLSPLGDAGRNHGYLFVPYSLPSGNALAFEPPNVTDPEVEVEAVNIGETEAELRARIDPNGGDTEYRIEYVSAQKYGESEFAEAQLAKSGTIAGNSPPQQVSVLVKGLSPNSTYHFRAVVENEVGEKEAEGFFATYSDAPTQTGPCPNEALRSGPSAGLADCRAYELVTPPDTNGGTPLGAGIEGDRFGSLQASPDGQAVSFELETGSVPGVEGTGGYYGDPFRVTRTATGWSSALAGPTGAEASKPRPGSVSPDQGFSLWIADGKGSAVLGAGDTHYVRYPDGHSELVGRGSIATDTQAIGRLITEGGTHIVFQTRNFESDKAIQLEPDAPPTGITAVYDRTADEVTHVVSLLPGPFGDITPTKDSLYAGASADGEGIAFTNEGKLYLRVGNETTYEIGSGATFAGLSEGGGRIFYLKGGDLFAYDTGEEKEITFADTAGPVVPVNVAPQGTRAYFVSEEAIAGLGPNPEGDEPQGGEQNLYLSEEGDVSFLATVTDRDVEGEVIAGTGEHLNGLGSWIEALEKRQPAIDPSRLDPTGSVLVFQSQADLTGYDSGEFPQIYRYDSVAGRLHCISCPPTETPAEGPAWLQSIYSLDGQSPFSPYGFVPNLTPDGDRAFFESTEALVSGDTDGFRDVYEWEEQGVGSCTRAGGCVYLISSPHSSRNEFLFGHGQSGEDVFFTSGEVLVAGDAENVSVYDARVGGGFANASKPECEGEACRPNMTPPPVLPGSQSGAGSESGNVTPQKPRHCPKGKRKVKRHGKVVCVKKKHKKHHKRQRANANGRAAK